MMGFDLLRQCGRLLRFSLRDGRVLQFDLAVEIVERGLCGGDLIAHDIVVG